MPVMPLPAFCSAPHKRSASATPPPVLRSDQPAGPHRASCNQLAERLNRKGRQMMSRHQIDHPAKSELMAPGRLPHRSAVQIFCEHRGLKIRVHIEIIRLVLNHKIVDSLHNRMLPYGCRYIDSESCVVRMMGEMPAQHCTELRIALHGYSVMNHQQAAAPGNISQQCPAVGRRDGMIGKLRIRDHQEYSLRLCGLSSPKSSDASTVNSGDRICRSS